MLGPTCPLVLHGTTTACTEVSNAVEVASVALSGTSKVPTIRSGAMFGATFTPIAGEPMPTDGEMLAAITRATSHFFRGQQPQSVFGELLADLLALTNSAYGYIGEALVDPDGNPYLSTWAHSNIAWDDATRAVYQDSVDRNVGLEFRNLNTLFGWGIANQAMVLANDPTHDPRAAQVPPGHPPLGAFLAIPLFRNDQMVGQIAVAGRPGGYSEELISLLNPFITVIASLIDTFRTDRERAEVLKTLEEEERLSSSLLSRLTDLVAVLDAEATMVYANVRAGQFIEATGVTIDQWTKGVHPEDLPKIFAALDEIARGVRSPDDALEFRARSVTGSTMIIEATGADHRANPAIGGFLIMARDITAKRRTEGELRERTAHLTTLVDALRDGVLFVTGDHRIAFANQAFCSLFGLDADRESLIGTHSLRDLQPRIAHVLREGAPAFIDLAVAARDQGGHASFEFSLPNGRTIHGDCIQVPIDGGVSGHLWLYRDITEQRRDEANRAAMLERERELREAVEETNRSLLELADLKNDIMATVSHELRTPLTSVVSYADLLRNEKGLSAEQREFAATIARNGERLMLLVDDLLLLARLESGGYELRRSECEVRATVDHVVRLLTPRAATASINLTVDVESGPPLVADANRIEQVLSNLVANAIKFTPGGGSVAVAAAPSDTGWTITVTDTGIGIPEDDLDLLFERFYRASNARSARTPGTGLGLVISRTIVELHGGTITLASTVGEGTTATVTIPFTTVH